VAGFTIAYTLQTLVILPAVGAGSAIAIVMNQCRAAGRPALAARAYHRGLLLVAAGYLPASALAAGLGGPVVRLLAADPVVREQATRYLGLVGPTFVCTGLVLATLTVLEQTGYGPVAVLLNVLYFAEIVGVGGWLTASAGDPVMLYRTTAAANLTGPAFVVVLALVLVRRGRRGAATPPAAPPATPPATPAPAPAWAAGPPGPEHRAAVLDFFTEPDFHFRTDHPGVLSEAEIDALLGDDARVLLAAGEPVGLYAVEPFGDGWTTHYRLHWRLRAGAPAAWWAGAFEQVVAALRAEREVVRLAVTVADHDPRGLAAADAAGLTREGVLAGVVVAGGVRGGRVHFARTWPPASDCPHGREERP
jgi:hypothetical protein